MALKGKKKKFVKAFRANGLNISQTCKDIDIDRSTYYDWMEKDHDFKAAVEDVEEEDLDFTESMLRQNIIKGDNTAIIFMLKTKGKKRGFVEKKKTELSGELNNKISGDLNITGMKVL